MKPTTPDIAKRIAARLDSRSRRLLTITMDLEEPRKELLTLEKRSDDDAEALSQARKDLVNASNLLWSIAMTPETCMEEQR